MKPYAKELPGRVPKTATRLANDQMWRFWKRGVGWSWCGVEVPGWSREGGLGVAVTGSVSWCDEQGISCKVAEMSLGHAVWGVERAHQRSDLLEQRREVMEQWGQGIHGEGQPG